jgi:hypothetical protein
MLALSVACGGCMRTDNHREEYYRNGNLKSLHYTSSTSWATDSGSDLISIDPNGLVKAVNYGKQEDSIKVKVNPTLNQYELETGE